MPSCLPTSQPLYIHKRSEERERTSYYPSLDIEWSSDLFWKVHLGDVVAISTKELNVKKIENWSPDHYKKESKHWKIGLVLGLAVKSTPTSQTVQCTVQYLEKILDTTFGKDKKIKGTFRPCQRVGTPSQLPHVLVNTSNKATVNPNLLLPVQIEMLQKKDFQQGVVDDDERNLKFCCLKQLTNVGALVETNPDPWAELNVDVPSSKDVPEPLKEAWLDWKVANEIADLLVHLRDGFKLVMIEKKNEKRRKILAATKEREQQEATAAAAEEAKSSSKTNKRKGDTKNKKGGKRIRFQMPGTENNIPPKQQQRQQEQQKQQKQRSSTKSNEVTKQIAQAKNKRKGRTSLDTTSTATTVASESTRSTTTSSSTQKQTGRKTNQEKKKKKKKTTTKTTTVTKRKKKRVQKEVVVLDESSSSIEVTPIGEKMMTCQYKDYFDSVQIPIDFQIFAEPFEPKNAKQDQTFELFVGQVVAVMVGEVDDDDDINNSNDDAWDNEPFDEQIQWSTAQIVAIYYDTRKKEWSFLARWFYKSHELKPDLRASIEQDPGFSPQKGVIEASQVDEIPMDSVLPAHVQVTSEYSWYDNNPITKHADGLPVIHLSCRHLQNKEESKIVTLKNDWNKYTDKLWSIPDPLARGLATIKEKKVANKYKTVIGNRRSDGYMTESGSSTEMVVDYTPPPSPSGSSIDCGGSLSSEEANDSEMTESEAQQAFEVNPLTTEPLYERWERKFYDGIRLEIAKKALVKTIRPKTQQWSIKVGFVVPIEVDRSSLPRGKKADYWYPFVRPWCAAQIISIYKKEDVWMIQIRWFNRYHELLDRQRKGLDKFDKPNVMFESEHYAHVSVSSVLPGRVIPTSNNMDDWKVESSFLTGLPLIPILCGHICLDDDIDSSLDWTNYDLNMNTLPSPLTRGLLLEPLNRDNKEWIFMLSRYYKNAIKSRGPDVDEQVLQKWKGMEGRPLQIYDDSTTFEPQEVEIVTCAEIFSTDLSFPMDFFQTVRIAIPRKYLSDPRQLIKRKRAKVHCFSCKIGDIVCFYDRDATKPADHILMKNIKHPWYPYQVPWSFGQILSIHSDEKADTPIVEIRRFYRFSDLPPLVQAFAPVAEEADFEDVFETDLIEEIPVSNLLGTAYIFLGHNEPTNSTDRARKEAALASCRCRYFYFDSKKRIQPLYSSGFGPGPWIRGLQQRGLYSSVWVMKYEKLYAESSSILFSEDVLDVSRLLSSGSKPSRTSTATAWPDRDVLFNSCQRSFFADALLVPKWSKFERSKFFCQEQDQDKDWKIKIGDFVAVRNKYAEKGPACYPFTDGWFPAQILAIYRDKNEMNDESQTDFLYIELRMLRFSQMPTDEPDLSQVEEMVPNRTEIVNGKDLLGPLLLCRHNESFESKWQSLQKHLPGAPCWAHESLSLDLSAAITNSKLYSPDDTKIVLSAVGEEQTLEWRKKSLNYDSGNDPSESGMAWTSNEPFHMDLSQLQSYYSKMNLLPSCQTKRIGIEQVLTQPWSVSMGDVVIIQCEGPRRYPLDCNWSVGEIVAIWKKFNSVDDLEKEHQLSERKESASQGVTVEIRWFYERDDFQGKHSLSVDENEDNEELFETDHVDVISGGDILAPAILGPDSKSLSRRKEIFLGIAVQKFLCNRFWSTTRKSLIPCGNLEGRQKRGWLYTNCLPIEAQQKYVNIESSPATNLPASDMTWKESMDKIIGKLSLQDASKGAYERGEALIGREKELDQLMKFFRSAIRGDRDGSVGSKSSIFLAGAPGVGKTACIRSAIARLRHEQAKGEIPPFNFIPLNGMEMRHPFECYGRFWEALTGVKHTGSYKLAKERLIGHFCEPRPFGKDVQNSVTVLLLDEIDYLISPTSDEDMLYDFFRWPQEAAEVSNGRRLVVVGISNTLNLHEQLQKRVGSRLGFQKCIFRSYNIEDTIAILKSKIKEASPNLKIFEDDAILLASKKIAGLSGDIRKAFQICRAATELVLQNWEAKERRGSEPYPKVRIGDVQKASRQLCNDGHARAISFLSSFEALLLISLASLCRTTGQEKGSFDIKDIMIKMEALAGASGHPQYCPAPSFGETLHLLNRLGELNLVGLQTAKSSLVSFRSSRGGSGGAWPLTTLNADEVTILQGIKNTPHKELAEKNLPCGF